MWSLEQCYLQACVPNDLLIAPYCDTACSIASPNDDLTDKGVHVGSNLRA